MGKATPSGGLKPTPGLVYYLDASLQLPVCRALALVRDDVRYPGGPNCPVTSPGMLDPEWLPVVRRGDDIGAKARSEPGPYIYSVTQAALKKIA